MKFILRRLVFYLVAAWAAITLNFILPRTMPGDPATTLIGSMRGRIKPEQLKAIEQAYGITNAPWWQQYLTYLSHVLRGDFGLSLSQFPVPVTSVIATGLQWSLLLGVVSLILGYLLGNLIGIIGAWNRGGWVDSLMPPILTLVGSFPYFFLALLVSYFLAFKTGWFPLSHAYSDDIAPGWNLTFAGSVIKHLILPAGTILLVSIGSWMFGIRNTMIGTLAEDYLAMAEAKGLSQNRIMFNYAARNAMLPNVTALGMSIGFIFSGQLLTEIVFSYPGLGYQLFQAVSSQDYPLMQALFLLITLSVLAANLIVDILYVRLDPRVRNMAPA